MIGWVIMLVGVVGALITVMSMWRLVVAIRARAPRPMITGLIAIMIASAVMSTVLIRVLAQFA